MRVVKIFFLVIVCNLLLVAETAFSQIRLPRLISDGMVLQRDAKIKIWGWSAPREKLSIIFNGKKYNATADGAGNWMITLLPMKAGGPYKMDISASNHITINNILVGDVWVCSGQSNMVLPMERVKEKYPNVIAHAKNQYIRQFLVPNSYVFTAPQKDMISGNWQSTDPQSVLNFTAVGYFFAKKLYEKYHVPIGLINASVGGSPAQAWLSEDALKKYPEYLAIAQQCKNEFYLDSIRKKENATTKAWYNNIWLLDKGEHGEKWFDVNYNASSWPVIRIPVLFRDWGLNHINGVVWLRKEIEVPASMTGKPAKLLLGRIVDADSTYINGQFVGTISYQYPPRRYDISPGLLKAGKNVIVVRVICNSGNGGFIADKPYKLFAGRDTVDLRGEWQYQIGAVAQPLPPTTFFQYKPLGLFNGMIAPVLNYSIRGVIWYQGEANTSNAAEYQLLLPDLIADWRKNWGQGDFPFLYVQLANFMEAKDEPGESNWAEIRESQLKTLSVHNTAMVVTTDIGEWNDIHPLDKQDVGERLALAAQKISYGNNKIVYSGPLYKSFAVQGNKIIISFTHTGSGLLAKGGGLKYFAIAGSDKKFVWAKAKIQDDKVIVWDDSIHNPVAVRYAWADNPAGANLYNKEGLPASSFRTDDWEPL